MLAKSIIKSKFDRAATSYDVVASVQKECATILVNYLREKSPHFTPTKILDLGTGTGYIPALLLPHFPRAVYTLNDLSDTMLMSAKHKFNQNKNIYYQQGDMEEEYFTRQDLVISNFSLQWVNDLPTTIKKFLNKTKIFAFTCLFDDSLKPWKKLLAQYQLPLSMAQYPSEKQMVALIKSMQINYSYKVDTFSLHFTHIIDALNYFKQLGATAHWHYPSLSKIKSLMKINHPIQITYQVGFFILG